MATVTLEALRKAFDGVDQRGVVSTYLFGSHADGRAHRESDVDIGVLFQYDAYPSRRDRFEQGLVLYSTLAAALGYRDVDIVVLNDAPAQLARRIVTRGIRILCVDAERDHAFVRDVQLRAADLEPFLQRMRAIKLDALAR